MPDAEASTAATPRPASPTLGGVLRRAGLILAGPVAIVVIGGALMVIGGVDPIEGYSVLLNGSVGSSQAIAETLIRFAPLAVIAVGLAPALRAGLFNIGATGQLGIGALAATLVGLALPGAPSSVILPITLLASIAGGVVWGLVPALLRSHFRVNEILSTLVFNFIGLYLLTLLLTGPLQGGQSNLPQSQALPVNAWLPTLIPDTRAHIGILVALLAVGLLAIFDASPAGYRLRLFGSNRTLARQAGVAERSMVLRLMLVAAGAAGIAGWMQVAGVDHRLYDSTASYIGFNGLFVALMGGSRAGGILLAGLFFGVLLKGGESMQLGVGVGPEFIDTLIGMVLLLVAARALLKRWRRA